MCQRNPCLPKASGRYHRICGITAKLPAKWIAGKHSYTNQLSKHAYIIKADTKKSEHHIKRCAYPLLRFFGQDHSFTLKWSPVSSSTTTFRAQTGFQTNVFYNEIPFFTLDLAYSARLPCAESPLWILAPLSVSSLIPVHAKLSHTQINRFCKGDAVRIDFSTIARLCTVLGCKVSDLIIYELPKFTTISSCYLTSVLTDYSVYWRKNDVHWIKNT